MNVMACTDQVTGKIYSVHSMEFISLPFFKDSIIANMLVEENDGAELLVSETQNKKKRKIPTEAERNLAKIAKEEANEDLHQALSKYLLSRTKDHVGPRLTVYEICKEHTKTSCTTMNRRIREFRIGPDEVLTEEDVHEKLKNVEKPAGRRPELSAETLIALQETAQNIDAHQPDHCKVQILQEALLEARKTQAESRGDKFRAANVKEFCPRKFREYTRLIAPDMEIPRLPRAVASSGSSSSSSTTAQNSSSSYASAATSFSSSGSSSSSTIHLTSVGANNLSSTSNTTSTKTSRIAKAKASSSISGTTHGSITRVPGVVSITTIGTQTLSTAPTSAIVRPSKKAAKP